MSDRFDQHPAQVVRIDEAKVWLSAMPKHHCSNCSVQAGCGQTWRRQLQHVSGIHQSAWVPVRRSAVQHLPDLAVGDRVWLAVPKSELVLGACQLYGVPVCSVLLGSTWVNHWGRFNDLGLAAVSFGLLVISFMAVRRWRNRQDQAIDLQVSSCMVSRLPDPQPVKGL